MEVSFGIILDGKGVSQDSLFSNTNNKDNYIMEENAITNENLVNDKFNCDICGEEFTSIVELTEHKLHHERPLVESMASRSTIDGDIGMAGLPTSPQ